VCDVRVLEPADTVEAEETTALSDGKPDITLLTNVDELQAVTSRTKHQ